MQRARIIGPKNEKTATGAIFVRMCDMLQKLPPPPGSNSNPDDFKGTYH